MTQHPHERVRDQNRGTERLESNAGLTVGSQLEPKSAGLWSVGTSVGVGVTRGCYKDLVPMVVPRAARFQKLPYYPYPFTHPVGALYQELGIEQEPRAPPLCSYPVPNSLG